MAEMGVQAVLLSSPENVFYTTGYPALPGAGNPILYALRNQFPFFSFIEQDGKITLLAWIGALLGGVEFAVDHVEMFADKLGGALTLKNFFNGKNLVGKRLGIEASCPYDICRMVEENAKPAGFVVIDTLMDDLRAVKSKQEIEVMRKCTQIVEATVKELMEIVKPGIRRPDLMREAKYRMLKNGADGVSHVTISFGASNPEVEIDEELEKDSLVILDIGASYQGYVSDIRRHVYTGKVPEGLIELHATMCDIVDTVSYACVPGKTARELYDLTVKLYEQNGLIPLIVNIGHTMGIQTEEIWLTNTIDLILQPGMVINLELYSTYEPTDVYIGDEETYLITERGAVQLTSLPRQIKCV
jgi:Xaa-Pro aminopeptidase